MNHCSHITDKITGSVIELVVFLSLHVTSDFSMSNDDRNKFRIVPNGSEFNSDRVQIIESGPRLTAVTIRSSPAATDLDGDLSFLNFRMRGGISISRSRARHDQLGWKSIIHFNFIALSYATVRYIFTVVSHG